MRGTFHSILILLYLLCFVTVSLSQTDEDEEKKDLDSLHNVPLLIESSAKEKDVAPEDNLSIDTEPVVLESDETPPSHIEHEEKPLLDGRDSSIEQSLQISDTEPITQRFTLTGTITQSDNGKKLAAVRILVKETNDSTRTDAAGAFSLTVPTKAITLSFTKKGYETIKKKFLLQRDSTIVLTLSPSAQSLAKTVVLSEKRDHNITSTEMSVEKFKIEDIESIPVIMGEKDIMKTIQLTPGITTITEGEIGFVVRGSGIDENLVLMDGMPLYYSSHQQGLYSVFNSDAVDNLKVYKGGMPVSYGGRTSSVLDVRMKGDKVENFNTKLSLGLVTSKFSLETPIIKDKLTLFGAGRSTKLSIGYRHDQIKREKEGKENPYSKPGDKPKTRGTQVSANIKGDTNEEFYFFNPMESWFDLNGKVVYNINNRNTLFLTGYFGRDSALTQGPTEWGNRAASLQWIHDYSTKFLSNTLLTYSRYYTSQVTGPYEFYSGIKTTNFKHEYTLAPNKNHDIRFGLCSEYQKYNHGALEDKSQDDAGKFMPPMQAIESALYMGNDQKITDKLSTYYGLRYSLYFRMGRGTSYTYDPVSNEPIDSTHFSARSDIMHTYHNPEPRFSLTYILNKQNSVKFFYNRSAQYVRLMTLGMQLQWYDIWMPCTKSIKPLTINQVATGYFGNFFNDEFQFSAETYYKWAKNSHAFEDGLHNYLVNNLEAYVAMGKGRSYGIELMLKKPYGTFNGWLSYNLGKSEKQIDCINKGRWFPSMFDKTHDITAVLCYNLFKNLSISATFLYSTGNAITLPEGYYYISNTAFPYWDGRNKYRLPPYHRLDLAIKYDLDILKKLFKKYDRSINASLELSGYNIYDRRNIVSMSYNTSGGKSGIPNIDPSKPLYQPYGISIYGFMPSFLLNIAF